MGKKFISCLTFFSIFLHMLDLLGIPKEISSLKNIFVNANTYFILQNMYLRIYENSFGARYLGDDCALTKVLNNTYLYKFSSKQLQLKQFSTAFANFFLYAKILLIICTSILTLQLLINQSIEWTSFSCIHIIVLA